MLRPEDAADVIEDISDAQAAEIIDDLSPTQAASILGELDSDHVADLLGELDEDEANAIIEQMSPDEAEEARNFLQYAPDTAGGLMISEYLAFHSEVKWGQGGKSAIHKIVGQVLSNSRPDPHKFP